MNILLTGSEGNFGSEFRSQATAKKHANVISIDREGWSEIDEKLASAEIVVRPAYIGQLGPMPPAGFKCDVHGNFA
jgi:dTDP-4-dehydrorhamnose reductase